MLPQFGFSEIVVLALLAIIVVGPKDLPKMMRMLGGWMSKIRAMGQEFKDAFDEMGAESEIAELRREINELKNMNPLSDLTDEELVKDIRDLDTDVRAVTDIANPKAES